jgi:hypothetical protein
MEQSLVMKAFIGWGWLSVVLMLVAIFAPILKSLLSG